MSDSPLVSIIIPAYNEEGRLPRTLEQVFNFLSQQKFSTEVIVVENGSTDRTFEIAESFAREHANFRALRAPKGKGSAVKQGALQANGEYIFICDADLSMPINEILRFLPPQLKDFDIAIGSREAAGAVRYDEPAYRHFTGRIFNTMIQALLLPGLNDTQCGFKCFHRKIAQDVFKYQSLMGWSFDVELLYIARLRGYKIVEIPIPWYFNADTKVNVLRDSWRMFFDLIAIQRNAKRGDYADIT